MVDGGTHKRYRVIVIPMPRRLTRHIRLDEWQFGQVVSIAQKYLANFGQELLPAVALSGCRAVHQRNAQRQLRMGQGEIVTRSFGTV